MEGYSGPKKAKMQNSTLQINKTEVHIARTKEDAPIPKCRPRHFIFSVHEIKLENTLDTLRFLVLFESAPTKGGHIHAVHHAVLFW